MTISDTIFCKVQEGLYINYLGKRWYPPRKSKHKVGESLRIVKAPMQGISINGKAFIIVKDHEIWTEE